MLGGALNHADHTTNTAELTVACQALYFLINDGGHWPAVIVVDSEISLSAIRSVTPGIRQLSQRVLTYPKSKNIPTCVFIVTATLAK